MARFGNEKNPTSSPSSGPALLVTVCTVVLSCPATRSFSGGARDTFPASSVTDTNAQRSPDPISLLHTLVHRDFSSPTTTGLRTAPGRTRAGGLRRNRILVGVVGMGSFDCTKTMSSIEEISTTPVE